MNYAKKYFVYYNGQQHGPMFWDDLLRKNFPSEALVWTAGMADWQYLGSIMPQPAVPPHLPGSQHVNVRNGARKSIYANFGMRLGAYIIDVVILNFAGLIFLLLFSAVFLRTPYYTLSGVYFLLYVLMVVFSWFYYALFESSELQATPGKMLLRLKVVDMNHNRIDFGRASGRFFGKILSSFILLIGYFMVLWTDYRQALHDQLANTLIIRSETK